MTMVGTIDIGSASISGCLVEHSRSGWKVEQYETLPLPAEPEGRAQAIRSLVGRLDLTHARVTVNLDRPIFVRNLEFPFSDLKKIEPLIAYELDDQIPMDVDELIITHGHTVHKDRTEVLVLAAAREEVAAQLQAFAEVGVEIYRLVHPANRAVFFSDPGEPCTVVIDVGARTTHLAAVTGGRLRACRTWADGMESVVESLARYSSQDPHQVRDWLVQQGRLSPAGFNEEGFEQVIRTEVERAFEEWRRFLLAFQTRHHETVERLVLIGEGARLPGLASAAASFFGIPAQLGQLPGEMIADPKRAGVVAQATLGLSNEALNFRRGEFALGAKDSLVKKKALAVMLGLGFFFTMMAGSALVTLWRLEREERDLLDLTGQLSTEVFGKPVYDPKSIRKQIKQKTEKSRGTGSTALLPRMSAWVLLSQISEKMPANAARPPEEGTGENQPGDPAPADPVPGEDKPGEKTPGDPVTGEKTPEEKKSGEKKSEETGKGEGKEEPKDAPISPVRVDLNKIHIRSGKVSLGGTVTSAQEVDEIVRALRRIECFQEISPGAIKTVGAGEEERREFTIEITMDCF
jgi:Tfp pilus assembly PilM family ATPase